MASKEKIEEKAWELLQRVTEGTKIRPVDAEYAKEGKEYTLVITIDKDPYVTIDDCEEISRLLDPLLDEEDFISDAYTLTVSSPGLTRQLRRPRDFIFARGRDVDVRCFKPVNGKREFTARFDDADEESVVLGTDEGTLRLKRSEISMIRLTFHE